MGYSTKVARDAFRQIPREWTHGERRYLLGSNRDAAGAITAPVYRWRLGEWTGVDLAGSLRIEADGRISRGPCGLREALR